MENKNNKLLIICIVLGLLVVGMLGYIIGNASGRKSNSAAEEITETSTAEASSDETTEADDKIETKDTDSTAAEVKTTEVVKDEASDGIDLLYVTVAVNTSWQEQKGYVFQYDIDVHNDSADSYKNWEVRVDGFKDGEIVTDWNAESKIDGNVLKCTAVDYNTEISPHSAVNIGVQVAFKDEATGKAVPKSGKLLINGNEISVKLEERADDKKNDDKKDEDTNVEPSKSAAAETGTPFDNHGKLTLSGTDIVDKNGDKYQLKGASTHGIAWFPEYVNKDAFKTLRDDWGANLVRLAMYVDENGGYCSDGDKDALKKRVSDGVEYATELGMYVIIDWHVLHDLNPLNNEAEAKKFFEEMSRKFAEYDNVIYEICNEPNGGTSWSDIKKYAEDIIPVIRENDKDAIILVGTPTWSQDVDEAAKDPLKGFDNVMYVVHFYAATHKDNIRNKAKSAIEAGLPVFISEFSICDASGNGGIDYDSAEDWMDFINSYNLSYAGWSLCNKDETSALIAASCDKKSGWLDSELSSTGKWLKKTISGN